MRETTTPRQLCEIWETNPDTLRMRYAKLRQTNADLFPLPWRIDGELSPEQVNELQRAGERKGSQPATKIESESVAQGVTHTGGNLDTGRSNEAAPQEFDGAKKWPLWAAFICTAGASVPNMFEVTHAVKGSGLVAYSLTAAFTVVPFLLIMARVRGLFGWLVVVGVMGYTAFCNTAAIFGGLTALDSGYILKPTVFLEAVTNLLNTDYLNTARYLAALMALLIGAIEFVAFKNLSK